MLGFLQSRNLRFLLTFNNLITFLFVPLFYLPIFFAAALVDHLFSNGNQKPGSPTFLCQQGVSLFYERMLMQNFQNLILDDSHCSDNAQGWTSFQ